MLKLGILRGTVKPMFFCSLRTVTNKTKIYKERLFLDMLWIYQHIIAL